MRGLDRMGKPNLTKTREKNVYSYLDTNVNKKRFAYRYRYTRTDGKKTDLYKQGFDTLKEASLALINVKADLLKGNYNKQEHGTMTMNELFEMYIKHQKNSLKVTTIRLFHFTRKKMEPLIGNVRICDLDKYIYTTRFIEVAKHSVADITLAKYHDKICAVLNFAVENEFIEKNKISRIKIEYTLNHKIIEQAAMKQIFTYTASRANYMMEMIEFLSATGVRCGEALGLKWSEVDLEEGTVTINCTRDAYGERSPKTKRSYRVIPLTSHVCEVLKKYQSRQKEELLKKGIRIAEDKFQKRYVFRNFKGDTLSYSSIDLYFRKMSIRLGVEKISPHMFRHTYASLLIAEGVDIATVASLLGDTIGTVQKTYVHSIEEKRKTAVNVIGKIMKSM